MTVAPPWRYTREHLMPFVPSWHACLVSSDNRYAKVERLIAETEDEAEDLVWEWLEEACDGDFTRSDWTMVHLLIQNGN